MFVEFTAWRAPRSAEFDDGDGILLDEFFKRFDARQGRYVSGVGVGEDFAHGVGEFRI